MMTDTAPRKPLSWNAEAFFRAAGGTSALRALLLSHKFDPPELDTLHVWRSRHQIPHRWVASCVLVLLLSGRAKLSELIESDGR